MVLVAVHRDDTQRDVTRLAERMLGYRVFPDAEGRMNRSLRTVGRAAAGAPVHADRRYEEGYPRQLYKGCGTRQSLRLFRPAGRALPREARHVETGRFGANMQVSLINDGPVTFWLDTHNRKYGTGHHPE